MKLREKLQKWLFVPLIGLLFAFFLCFVNSPSVSAAPTPVKFPNPLTILADLEDGEPETAEAEEAETSDDAEAGEDAENSEASSEDDQPATCYDELKGIGWLVCPTSGALAKTVDGIENIIDDLLVVEPMTTDSTSPIYQVWQIMRDFTNIVFIILIIVVIYSQLTGVGLDNYNIKKILPKIIITAILINLSYLICSIAVDASNIIGSSLRGFLGSIEETIAENANYGDGAIVTWEGLAGILIGGGAAAGFAISAAGGLGAILPMLLVSLLGAALSVAVGLVTIAMRQAVVSLLVMVAPLALVCYMLPNTDSWFKKWKDILISMLIFYPMFSLLFGASHLAGWALIIKAHQDGSWFTLILGMAVQVVPLFFSVSLMKMSNTILGKISSKLDGGAKGITGKVRPFAEEARDAAKARKLAEASRSGFNPLSGASVSARIARARAIRNAERATNEESFATANALHVSARKSGRKIIGWSQDGTPIYSRQVSKNRSMREEYKNRELKLSAEGEQLRLDNAMSDIKAYMRAEDFEDDELKTASAGQAKNYLNLRTQQSAKSRNDRADQRFYFEQVREASKNKNSHAYKKLVEAGAGADFHSDDATIRQNALSTVVADSYEAYEKERAETSKRYTTLFDKQVTKEVLTQYKEALRANNIDAVTAAQNTLAKRGDYDKVSQHLREYMDHTGDFKDLEGEKGIKLGEDFANVLALNLLGMKGADPLLARLGKSINMETWQSTSRERASEYMTFEDYVFGGDEKRSRNKARTSLTELMKGTSIKDADRTFFGDLEDTAKAYNLSDEQFKKLITNMMPQFISAIPTYESGGEQITKSMQTLTGMTKFENGWAAFDKNKEPLAARMDLIKTYIGGMTDKDLNAFKTDSFEAICEAIASTLTDENGKQLTCYEHDNKGFPTKFKEVPPAVSEVLRKFANDDMLATIQNNVNQGTNVGMKPRIMRAFGIKVPDAYQDNDNG